MMTCQRFFLGFGMLAASTVATHAGPCASQIDRMQGRVDAWLEAIAERGAAGPESSDAKLHRQPTPRSIEAAETRLGDLPAEAAEAVNAAMQRARHADAANDLATCEKAIDEAQRLIRQQ